MGWTEVQSKKTQQKMKALSRQSSFNKIPPTVQASNQRKSRKTYQGKLQHSATLQVPCLSQDKMEMKKSYSQALSQEDKSVSTLSQESQEHERDLEARDILDFEVFHFSFYI